jgi:hypothetical protein
MDRVIQPFVPGHDAERDPAGIAFVCRQDGRIVRRIEAAG